MAETDANPIPLAQRRPLSPHLQVYRWSLTMAASILHRATGVALYAGTVLLVAYLFAAAMDERAFSIVSGLYASIIGLIILFGYTFALMLHLCGGIRHAIWDAGAGFDPKARDALAIGSFVGAAVLTAAIWIVGLLMMR